MINFILRLWRTMTIGKHWRPARDERSLMIRYVNGRIEYRPMTAEEDYEFECWMAIK